MRVDIDLPDAEVGVWRVETFGVSEEEAKFERLRSIFSGGRGVPEGTYKRLMRGSTVVMSNTPDEINDCLHFIHKARKYGGNILINGLGLGVVLRAILESDMVENVTVIENSSEVIELVGPYFQDDRVRIIQADALEWKPPKGEKYDFVWHDIWDNICGDNYPEMNKLHRKYGRRTGWQDSWCRELCRAYR